MLTSTCSFFIKYMQLDKSRSQPTYGSFKTANPYCLFSISVWAKHSVHKGFNATIYYKPLRYKQITKKRHMCHLREQEKGNLSSSPCKKKGCFILKGMQGIRSHLLFTRAIAIKHHTILKARLFK